MATRFSSGLVLLVMFCCGNLAAAEPAEEKHKQKKEASQPKPRLIKLSKDDEVWVDPKRKLVVVGGRIAIDDGPLEMFACPAQTKEHESLIAIDAKAQLVHAGLLVIGAKPGHPVRFNPEYVAARGSVIDIWVLWQDEKGKHRVRGQDLVKDIKTEKAMKHDWVFGGSGFWTDEETGKKYYHADGGDFICLSNFSTATLDLPIESSQANDALLFTAFKERIPPRGTKVKLVLMLRKKKEQNQEDAKSATSKDKSSVDRIVDEKAEIQQ
jgi:hypothetical protein